jgi:hypothetical protein
MTRPQNRKEDKMVDRDESHAYLTLRASSRRLLRFIETAIERQGGNAALFDDELAVVGSSRVYKFGCRELHALGFIEFAREDKRNTFTLSQRWRSVTTQKEATLISARARHQQRKPQQPATASSNAQA